MSLSYVVYRSCINREFLDDLDDIALAAGRYNSANLITGCLFQVDNFYFQIIEGPSATVQALLEKIRADRRHSDMAVIDSAVIEARRFPSWSMGTLTDEEVAHVFGAGDNTELLDIFSGHIISILSVFDEHKVTQTRLNHIM
jgi:hypothetical protein